MSDDPAATELGRRFAELVAGGPLPLPGAGATPRRWRRLAEVAAEDLALAKLYESHADALAIQAELAAAPPPAGSSWAVWAAEPPQARLAVRPAADGVTLHGRKAWCSGARTVSHALVTGWTDDGEQQLVAVRLTEPGIAVHEGSWQAVGMGRVDTPDLTFDGVPGVPVGRPGGYLDRPGFWHGGCGIAACWYGGALPLARAVLARVADRDDPHAAAHLGQLDVALRSVRALLAETAGWIDAHPAAPAAEAALRLRAAADGTARRVLDLAGRALGAGPLCRDRAVARQFADLPVFIRQTHAERDLAELGRAVAATGAGWQL
ncbi:MAG TPA: hypothetical protein VMB79_03890 [Jatrophihabitans sp.]|nr:hypothetical protein [Jatrophihabitans sp.]